DWQVFVVVAVGGDVAAAVLPAHFNLQLAAFTDRRDVHVLVEYREVRVFFDLRGGYWPRLLNIYIDWFRQVRCQLDGHLLEVENNVRGIFHYTGDRRKFVQYAFDFHRGDRRAFNRAQQSAPQRVPNRRSPAPLERLRGKTAVLFRQRFEFRGKTLRLLK